MNMGKLLAQTQAHDCSTHPAPTLLASKWFSQLLKNKAAAPTSP